MESTLIRMLIVEDEAAHVEAIRRALKAAGTDGIEIRVAGTLSEYRECVAASLPDIALVDLNLPDGRAVEVLTSPPEAGPFPVLVMTSYGNEQTAVEALKSGALDYVVKSPEAFANIPRTVTRALREWNLLRERKRAEEELSAYQNKLSDLVEELSRAEERERRRIASELHDQVGQSLTLIMMKINVLVSGSHPAEVIDSIEEIKSIVDQSIQEVRHLTFQISPPILYECGLGAALEWLAEEFQEKYGLHVNFRADAKPKSLSEEAGTALFQVVRELLFNITKHAHTRNAQLLLTNAGDQTQIRVEDDGAGFDSAAVKQRSGKMHGFGLFNISQRISRMGGNMAIESEAGHGTRIILSIPAQNKG